MTVQSKLGIVSSRNYLEPRTARSRAREDIFPCLTGARPFVTICIPLGGFKESRLEY